MDSGTDSWSLDPGAYLGPIAIIGDPDQARAAARELPVPFITKDNQGGKGLGVRRFDSRRAFDAYLAGPDWAPPVDHTRLLQEYVEPAQAFITRVEAVGGEFLYALTADTSGGFELCPADACAVGDEFCLADGGAGFRLRTDFTEADARPWVEFARRWDVEIARFLGRLLDQQTSGPVAA